jgi:hypothetical protein
VSESSPRPLTPGGHEVGERRYTFMLVPPGGRGSVRQVTLSLRQLRRWVGLVAAVVLLAGVGLYSMIMATPSWMETRVLVEENLELRSTLFELEASQSDLEAEIERLRLYESQLKGLDPALVPGFGPMEIDELAWQAWMGEGVVLSNEGLGALGAFGDPLDDHAVSLSLLTEDRPMKDWLADVKARTALSLERARAAELEMGHLVESAEHLRARQAAAPSGWPVDGVLTSGFGVRVSPITNSWKFHKGLDISAPIGRPVYAPGGGEVIMARPNAGYGLMVEIDHGFGIVSRYAHNSVLYVLEGDEVVLGQPISAVGMTGSTTGPHLHYEITIDSNPVDPMEYLE